MAGDQAFTEAQAEALWRALPDTYAATISGGKWLPYSWLTWLSDELTGYIVEGGYIVVVEAPPRHGKSEFLSHYLPTWYLDQWPENRVILTSYEDDFASTWGRKVRDELQMNELVNAKVKDGTSARRRWDTQEGGGMYTAGARGAIVGKGGNLILVDDPIKGWKQAMSETFREDCKDWFRSVVFTRLEPGGTVVILMQRWHEDDLAGWAQNEFEGHSDVKLATIRLPAIAGENDPMGRKPGQVLCKERYPKNRLQTIKGVLGTAMFNTLYQQDPQVAGGNVFKPEWFKHWTQLPEMDMLVLSWDLTFKGGPEAAYNVGQLWGKKDADFYLISQVRAQLEFTGQLEAITRQRRENPTVSGVLIEDAANGAAAVNVLRQKVPGVIPIPVRDSKEIRAQAISPLYEAGNVWHPCPKANPWVEDMETRFTLFPDTKYKDEIDAATQALMYLKDRHSNIDFGLVRLGKESTWRR